MSKKKVELPKVIVRSDRNLAYVTVRGRKIYLGKPDSHEALLKFREVCGNIFDELVEKNVFVPPQASANRRGVMPPQHLEGGSMKPITNTVTIVEIFENCLDQLLLRKSKKSREISLTNKILEKLRKHFPDTLARDFGPKALRQLREYFIVEGYMEGDRHCVYSRYQINCYQQYFLMVYKKAQSFELVTDKDYFNLTHVGRLRVGEDDRVPERTHRTKNKFYVTDEYVEIITNQIINPIYRDMFRLQLLTGMRDCELVAINWREITKGLGENKDQWVFEPANHKTAYTGKKRPIGIGPEAQAILIKYANEPDYIFNPRSILEATSRVRAANRKTPLWKSHMERNERENTGRKMKRSRKMVDPSNYAKVVRRAVQKAIDAGLIDKRITPYDLRAKAITDIIAKHGIHTAQHFAGHQDIRTTQIYDRSEYNVVLAATADR